MDTEKFINAYGESRNGANQFFRHPLSRKFAYSDGVQELAESGTYWLLDILATELPAEFRRAGPDAGLCIVRIKAEGSKALITAEFTDDVVAWSKTIGLTDLPDGEWILYVNDDGGDTPFRCILPTEY